MRVTRFVFGRVVAADEQFLRPGERRFDGDALVDGNRSSVAAEVTHHGGGLGRRGELAASGVDVQDATLEVIVGERGFGAQRLQLAAAVERERDDLADVVARPARRALAEEAQAPVEQGDVPPRAKQQGRVFAQHPRQSP